MLSIYGYQAYSHYHDGNSLYIHQPSQTLSMAENILHILRPDSSYTPLEAKILDIALILHMEHGGGNNSSFTTRVVTSSLSDTYSVIAAAIGSLKEMCIRDRNIADAVTGSAFIVDVLIPHGLTCQNIQVLSLIHI